MNEQNQKQEQTDKFITDAKKCLEFLTNNGLEAYNLDLIAGRMAVLLSQTEARVRAESLNGVDKIISKLLAEIANTPLEKRVDGWSALLELRDKLKSL